MRLPVLVALLVFMVSPAAAQDGWRSLGSDPVKQFFWRPIGPSAENRAWKHVEYRTEWSATQTVQGRAVRGVLVQSPTDLVGVFRPVTVGMSNDTNSEILSGLQEGDTAILPQTTATGSRVPGMGGMGFPTGGGQQGGQPAGPPPGGVIGR